MMKDLRIAIACVLCMTLGVSATEYPEFRSAVSTTGITANFDALYSQANILHMYYDLVNHDGNGIVWKYNDTGSWGILKDDGTVAIASTSAFSLDVKEVLDDDLIRAKNLVITSGGSISDAPFVYYVDDPYLYRTIVYEFDSNFNLNLYIPEWTLESAKLSVTGSDFAETDDWDNDIITPGQHYWLDGSEVSGCDAVYCDHDSLKPKGISCVSQACHHSESSPYPTIKVRVAPVDITGKITPGIHRVEATGIDDQHTMIIGAVTSINEDEMLLHSDDYVVQIPETRSSPMTALYELIAPSETANTTIETSATNSTL
jgi:hypothetical protein